MKIGLVAELTFASEEESDLFLFIKSDFNKNEVDFVGLTFEQILEKTFEEITDLDERREFKSKIRLAMVNFLAKLDDFGKEENSE